MSPKPIPAASRAARTDDHAHVIALPPLLFLASALAGGFLHLRFHARVTAHAPAWVAGLLCFAVAGWLALWAKRVMHAAGTNIRPDKPALAIVADGPFRFTRNPMYVALCLLQAGIGLALDDWIALLLTVPLALTLHYGVILREEAYLERKFGEPYLALKRRVRRWL